MHAGPRIMRVPLGAVKPRAGRLLPLWASEERGETLGPSAALIRHGDTAPGTRGLRGTARPAAPDGCGCCASGLRGTNRALPLRAGGSKARDVGWAEPDSELRAHRFNDLLGFEHRVRLQHRLRVCNRDRKSVV